MKKKLALTVGILAVTLLTAGCGSEVKIVSVTKTVERTVTADPTDDDYYATGDDLAPDVKSSWNEDYPDNAIGDVVCTGAPNFQNDTSRWECSAIATQTGNITIKVKVDQETGSFTYQEE